MKKKCILALILGAAFMAQGCGFTEGTDAVVTVVDSTPTPEPTEAPEETATPTPEATAEADSTAAADPTAQAAATEQTPSGINVQAQDATYYAVEGVNLRSDASADAEFVAGVLSGESLKCTGICDNVCLSGNKERSVFPIQESRTLKDLIFKRGRSGRIYRSLPLCCRQIRGESNICRL